VGLALLVGLTLALRYAQPLQATDLWWQMAYGRYFLEQGTLIPDHTAFTWTPAVQETIYCAWLAEVFLHALYCVAALPGMFALRYLCLLVLLLAVWRFAVRRGVARHPLTWLIGLLALLMSQTAAHVKPEMLSFLLMTLSVAAWMRIKSGGDGDWRWCYALPALMLVWVNSHGAFVFGVFFLLVMGVAEGMNALYSPDRALPLRVRQHLFASLVLSALALLATPYGPRYLIQTARVVAGGRGGMISTVMAYDTIFNARQQGFRFAEYGVLAAAVLTLLCCRPRRGRGVDWALLLVNVAFGLLYTRFLRTTFYWAPIFGLSGVRLLAGGPEWLARPRRKRAAHLIGGVVALACAWLGGRAVYEHALRPKELGWLGFGVGYANPVEAAEYLDEHCSGWRLGNDYGGGGYLLWRLAPETKVLIDPRAFPFRSWYEEYREFELGRSIRDFVRKHPCEVWCVRHRQRRLVSWFTSSPDWVPAFYGPVAAVFVRRERGPPTGRVEPGKGIGDVRNLTQALLTLGFALNVGDMEGSDRIVAGMTKRFRHSSERTTVAAARAVTQGVQSYVLRDYRAALQAFETAEGRAPLDVTALRDNCRLNLALQHWCADNCGEALRLARAALASRPNDLLAVYDVAVIEWHLRNREQEPGADEQVRGETTPDTWTGPLQSFLELAEGDRRIPPRALEVARRILGGKYARKPPLIVPPAPPGLARRRKN